MRGGIKQALIRYGLQNFAQATQGDSWEALFEGVPGVDGAAELNWAAYERCLHGDRVAEPERALTCIFSLVRDGEKVPTPTYHSPQVLSFSPGSSKSDAAAFPASMEEVCVPSPGLWEEFRGEFEAIPHREIAPFFEAFYHLYLKYAWALPCRYGERGVSLFEQWKAVAALVSASGGQKAPASRFTLIGGDIPGIQKFVYTITSKGAAKGLRGRSFFLQLLGQAVVRRLVVELDLCRANVIYAAGGNFLVLGPLLSAQVSGQTVRNRLERLQEEVDKALLDELDGDLALALAWIEVGADAIGWPAFGIKACREVHGRVAARKGQVFAGIGAGCWRELFGPQGEPGNQYCVICHRPLGRGEGIPMEETREPGTGQPSLRCEACDGFQRLAERIAGAKVLAIGTRRPSDGGQRWQEILWRVTRCWYDFDPSGALSPGMLLYTLNDTRFLAKGAHGFALVANVTPRVTQADVARWERRHAEGRGDPDQEPRPGTIRTFAQMADVARGVKRVGVLRMDVDNLGQIVGSGLEEPTMARVSALSAALDRFFAGRLNAICQGVNALGHETEGRDRGDGLYVIYSGGDDLFVVGSWDLLPELAEKVCDEFAKWTGGNPAMHISGGITVEEPGAPLYQMAKRAGEAERRAKSHERDGVRKDAISFLGMAFKWDEWSKPKGLRQEIERLVTEERVPRALIQILLNIYTQFEEEFRERYRRMVAGQSPADAGDPDRLYYGPWMWRQAYALSRLAGRLKEERVKDAVLALQVEAISPGEMRYVGLAARWAELLTRGRKEGEGE